MAVGPILTGENVNVLKPVALEVNQGAFTVRLVGIVVIGEAVCATILKAINVKFAPFKTLDV